MQEGYKTTEFWLSTIVSLLGMAATLGFVAPEQADTLTRAVTEIFGAVAAIYTTVKYIKSRTELKVAGIRSDTELQIAGIRSGAVSSR